MDQKISTPAMAGIILVVVAIVAFVLYRGTATTSNAGDEKKAQEQGMNAMRQIPIPGGKK